MTATLVATGRGETEAAKVPPRSLGCPSASNTHSCRSNRVSKRCFHGCNQRGTRSSGDPQLVDKLPGSRMRHYHSCSRPQSKPRPWTASSRWPGERNRTSPAGTKTWSSCSLLSKVPLRLLRVVPCRVNTINLARLLGSTRQKAEART